MATYGTDWTTWVDGVPDLDPMFGWAEEDQAVIEVAARRLMTPRGTLPGDPDFGTDLRVYCGARITPHRLAILRQDIKSELLKDERVLNVEVSSTTFDQAASKLTVRIALTTANGTFALTLTVDQVKVTLLHT